MSAAALVPVEAGTPVRECSQLDLTGTEKCDQRAVVVIRAHLTRGDYTSEAYGCAGHSAGRAVDLLLRKFPDVDEIVIRPLAVTS